MTKDSPTKALEEAGKEALRLLVFALPAVLIQVVATRPTFTNTVAGGALLIVLRALDRYIHENKEIPANGLVPF